jgi:hypothetical protein
MKNIKTKLILIFLIVIVSQNFIYSQIDNKKKMQRIIRQKFIEKLEISDSLGDKFFKIYNKSINDIRVLNKEKKDLMESIENNLDASDMSSKTDRIFEIDQQIENSKKDFYNELKTIFNYKQIAQTIIFQRNLKQFLNKELRKRNN